MRQIVAHLFNSLWGGLATGVIIALAVLVPVMVTAETTLKLHGSLAVANVTTGDTAYKPEIDAKYDQVVKIQVFYKNPGKGGGQNAGESTDAANANAAKNIRAKIVLPTQAGRGQVVNASIKADNSEELTAQATVKLEAEEATLQYIPGSAVWKHNTGSRERPTFAETKVGDEVVVSPQGLAVGDVPAGNEYSATITILARVMRPGVHVTTESQLKGESNKWSANNSAKPGDTLRYLISYQNTNNTEQKQVVMRDVLPAKVRFVSGTAILFNTSNPNGTKLADSVAVGGVNIGNYGPGANAYVVFEATIAPADQLACGGNELRNLSAIRPEGMSEYYATAVTTVARDCPNPPASPTPAPAPAPVPTPIPAAPTPQPKPTYSCEQLTITKGGGRKITAKVDYKAVNGAKLKTATYDFGDGSRPLVTDKTTVEYTYPKDGNYTVVVKLTITANGKDETVTSAPCAQSVSLAVAPVAPPTSPAPPAPAKGNLPNSGAGDMVGLFGSVSFIGFVAHRAYLSRRFARR